VERGREHAGAAPLELMALARVAFDLRAAGTGQHIERGLEDMALRKCLPGRRQVQQEHRHGVAAALEVGDRAIHPETPPVPSLAREQIEPDTLVDRNALVPGPVEVWVDHVLAGRDSHVAHILLAPERLARAALLLAGLVVAALDRERSLALLLLGPIAER